MSNDDPISLSSMHYRDWFHSTTLIQSSTLALVLRKGISLAKPPVNSSIRTNHSPKSWFWQYTFLWLSELQFLH